MVIQNILSQNLIQFTLTNASGMEANILNLGATLMSFCMPDRNGKFENVVICLPKPEDYYSDHPFLGSTIGRVGNRIKGSQFEINGKLHKLDANLGEHQLHGGKKGFHSRIWKGEIEGNRLVFHYHSPEGENGYPGNLDTKVSYELTDAGELIINFSAETDADTHVNMTQHAYFNLCGDLKRDIREHVLHLNGKQVNEVDEMLIPTGNFLDVLGGPLDFTSPKPLGKDIESDDASIQFAGGYDHNYVLDRKEEGLFLAAILQEPVSGRKLTTYTTQPGLQIFTANGMDDAFKDISGESMCSFGAICLEPQHFPDTPHNPHFPSTLLKKGEKYKETIVYHFEVEE